MMGRTTLREVRETLAAAKRKKGSKAIISPVVRELESLAQLLKEEVETRESVEEPRKKKTAEQDAPAHGGGSRGSRRSPRTRGPRRR